MTVDLVVGTSDGGAACSAAAGATPGSASTSATSEVTALSVGRGILDV